MLLAERFARKIKTFSKRDIMSLINGLLGNAEEIDIKEVQIEYGELLIDNEQIVKVYILIRDRIIFTDRRIIFENVQGITGLKVSVSSIPYKNIVAFTKESAGLLDLNGELVIHVNGLLNPLKYNFSSNTNINEVYMLMSEFVLNDTKVNMPFFETKKKNNNLEIKTSKTFNEEDVKSIKNIPEDFFDSIRENNSTHKYCKYFINSYSKQTGFYILNEHLPENDKLKVMTFLKDIEYLD